MASAGPRGRKEERAAWGPEHLVVALQSYRKLGGQPLPTVPSRPLFASRCAGTVVRAAMLHARQSGSRVGEVLEVRIYIYILRILEIVNEYIYYVNSYHLCIS